MIAGDSWGTGEIGTHDPDQPASRHTGLQFFLEQQGHEVVNVARPMNSNFEALRDLDRCLSRLAVRNRIKDITGVLFFQTEWQRDFHISCPQHMNVLIQFPSFQFWKPSVFGPELIMTYLSTWQRKLSDLARDFDLKIGLIGGCSDTMWLGRFSEEYPGLYIACQSVTNLCVNNNHRINEPVFAVMMHENFLDHCKNDRKVTDNDLEFIIRQVDLGLDRIKLWESYPDWFYPDGRHANRRGHQRLFEHLSQNNFI